MRGHFPLPEKYVMEFTMTVIEEVSPPTFQADDLQEIATVCLRRKADAGLAFWPAPPMSNDVDYALNLSALGNLPLPPSTYVVRGGRLSLIVYGAAKDMSLVHRQSIERLKQAGTQIEHCCSLADLDMITARLMTG